MRSPAATERAWRESEQRYSAFIQNSSEAIWRFELEHPVPVALPPAEQIDAFYRWSYLAECNDAMARLYGFASPAQAVGVRLGDFLPRNEPANIAYLEAFIAAGHRLIDAESIEKTNDGTTKILLNSLRAVIEDGKILRAWGTSRDITARKEVERQLREAEERFRLILESATDYAIFTLDRDRRVTTWNTGATRVLGYAASEIIGQSGDVLFVPEDRAAGAPRQEAYTAEREGRAENERWHLRKDGTRFYGTGVTHPLHGPSGPIIGFLKIMRDTTERREAEETRRRHLAETQKLNETLEEKVRQRTAELSEANKHLRAFAHTVAHDLRGPLHTVREFSEILSAEHAAALGAEGAHLVGRIHRATERMDALINSVLGYSRMLSAELRLHPVRVAAIAEEIVERNEPLIRRARARVDVSADLPTVIAHAGLLSQALENLVTNALKFMPPGRDPVIKIEGTSSGPRARVIVRDNGIGISDANVAKIFGLFQRLHTETEFAGTGVGLAIVQAAAERMGGSVGLESTEGAGSAFWIELPRAMDGPAA